MGFDLDKKNALNKTDKSKKKGIDKNISKLVALLNSKNDFYTTSSCAGRILLISFPENNRKYNVKWLFISHEGARFEDVKISLEGSDFEDIWLKQEAMIMHVCCRNLRSASKLIETARHLGFKRSGINTMAKRIVLELVSTENMETPIAKKGRLLVDDKYLKILLTEANSKLRRTHEKIKKLYEELSSL